METQGFYLAVLDADGRRFGLVVDELLDPEEIVVKPLSPVLRQVGLFSGAAVLGNGTLALILDPSAAAARAGVSLQRDSEQGGASASARENPAVAADAKEPEFLVFAAGTADIRQCLRALPLERVVRIETVPYGRIEYAGRSPVLRFRGGILQLRDIGGLLPGLEQRGNAETAVSIVVCHGAACQDARSDDEGRPVGLVVREVLEVATGRMLHDAVMSDADGADVQGWRSTGSTGSTGLVLAGERVVRIFDLGEPDFTCDAEAGPVEWTGVDGRMALAGRELQQMELG